MYWVAIHHPPGSQDQDRSLPPRGLRPVPSSHLLRWGLELRRLVVKLRHTSSRRLTRDPGLGGEEKTCATSSLKISTETDAVYKAKGGKNNLGNMVGKGPQQDDEEEDEDERPMWVY